MTMAKMTAAIQAELERIGAAAKWNTVGLQVYALDLLPEGWVRIQWSHEVYICGPADEILRELERCQSGSGANKAWDALQEFLGYDPRSSREWPEDLITVEQLEPGTLNDNPNCLITVRCNAGLRYTAGPHGANYCALEDTFRWVDDLYRSPEKAMADLEEGPRGGREESTPVTRYRVYEAPDGGDPSYCGEFDSLEEAEEYANTEPTGLVKALWDTARAAGHCAGMTAPPGGGIEEDEPLSWHGEQGWHCVVEVTYPAKDNN